MSEHYSKTTVEVKHWCKKCSTFTMHDVYGGRVGACQTCVKQLEQQSKRKSEEQPAPRIEQGALFP